VSIFVRARIRFRVAEVLLNGDGAIIPSKQKGKTCEASLRRGKDGENNYLENRLLFAKVQQNREHPQKMPADNERFGATAAGRADLKGSAGNPPLRQAAIPLAAILGQSSDNIKSNKKYRKYDNEYL